MLVITPVSVLGTCNSSSFSGNMPVICLALLLSTDYANHNAEWKGEYKDTRLGVPPPDCDLWTGTWTYLALIFSIFSTFSHIVNS